MNQKPICLLDLGGVTFLSTGESNDEINWPVISKLNYIYGHDLNIGKDVFPEFIKAYNSRTGLNLDGDLFLQLLWETLSYNNDLIDRLKEMYDIVIVSDNYRENIDYIAKLYDFDSWAFDEFYSFDFELEKSDPIFFEQLIKETGWKGSDLIFIDDSQSKLDSAAQQGIKGFLFKSNEQLFAEIDSHLH